MLSPAIIEVTGDYLSIMNYITSIEKDHRIAEVNDVNISNESGVIKGVINVKYYYVDGMNANTTSYDFNKGAYGKGNLFK